MSSWPSGGVDGALEALQQRYVPDMVHVDIPGLLQDAALGSTALVSSFGAETFTVNELAERVQQAGRQMGLDVEIKSIPNPRKEKEEHYYNPTHSGLTELGLKPHYMSEAVLGAMLERIIENRDLIVSERIMPRVRWS